MKLEELKTLNDGDYIVVKRGEVERHFVFNKEHMKIVEDGNRKCLIISGFTFSLEEIRFGTLRDIENYQRNVLHELADKTILLTKGVRV